MNIQTYDRVINKSEYFMVNWVLSNVCNFKCSYCKPFLHASTEQPPSLDSCMKFLLKIKEEKKDKKICLGLSGGEPTIWKVTSDLLKECKKNDITTMVNSNGSSNINWWLKNSKYIDCVILSYHEEGNYFDNFCNICKFCIESGPDMRIDFLPLPNNFDIVFEKAIHLAEQYFYKSFVCLRPMRVGFDGDTYEYSDEQMHKILTFNPFVYSGKKKYIEAVKMNGTTFLENLIPDDEIISKRNSYTNWKCNAGVESIFIEIDKIKYAINCTEKMIGSIYDEILQLPNEPIICEKRFCQCRLNLLFSKHKENM